MGSRGPESTPEKRTEAAYRASSLEIRRRLTVAGSDSFPRNYRLTRGGQLRLVLRDGKRFRTQHLELRVIASVLHHPRIGFIVPKHGRSIVERNRLKRRLREIIRLTVLKRIPPVDMIVRAQPDAYSASFALLEQEIAVGRDRVQRLFSTV